MCQTCGTQFAVRDDDGNYYKHLADALAIESVDDVTLVADDTLSEDVTLIKDIFFYPNGHTVSGGGANRGAQRQEAGSRRERRN